MAAPVLLAFVFGVAMVFGIYYAVTLLPGMLQQRALNKRLEEVSKFGPPDEEGGESRKAILKELPVGPLPALDRLVSGSNRGSAIRHWLEQSGTKTSVSSIVLLGTGIGLVVGMVVSGVARAGWSFPLGFTLGFAMPFVVLKIKRTRRLRAFEEQFPEGLDLIARALKAGHAFATGLKMVADEMPDPVGPEFRKTFEEQNFGLPLKDALENLTHRVPSLDVRFFATAVLIQRDTGGNLSEILENLAHVVRERFKILRQVRVYTAHGRFTGWVLMALPAFLGVALYFINPDHMNLLFREQMGRLMLMGGLVMQTIGYLWIKQVIKIEV
jgi:tight adherence protein B